MSLTSHKGTFSDVCAPILSSVTKPEVDVSDRKPRNHKAMLKSWQSESNFSALALRPSRSTKRPPVNDEEPSQLPAEYGSDSNDPACCDDVFESPVPASSCSLGAARIRHAFKRPSGPVLPSQTTADSAAAAAAAAGKPAGILPRRRAGAQAAGPSPTAVDASADPEYRDAAPRRFLSDCSDTEPASAGSGCETPAGRLAGAGRSRVVVKLASALAAAARAPFARRASMSAASAAPPADCPAPGPASRGRRSFESAGAPQPDAAGPGLDPVERATTAPPTPSRSRTPGPGPEGLSQLCRQQSLSKSKSETFLPVLRAGSSAAAAAGGALAPIAALAAGSRVRPSRGGGIGGGGGGPRPSATGRSSSGAGPAPELAFRLPPRVASPPSGGGGCGGGADDDDDDDEGWRGPTGGGSAGPGRARRSPSGGRRDSDDGLGEPERHLRRPGLAAGGGWACGARSRLSAPPGLLPGRAGPEA